MKKFFLLLLLVVQISKAQERVIATIDEQKISAEEVLYAYNKNRADTLPLNYDSLNLYLERYINFKLKVLEARAQGLDQSKTFQSELNGYLKELRKPYTEGLNQEEELIEEAYARMQTNIKAAHILIPVQPDASPSDTLQAYTLLDSLRSTINTAEDFANAARRYSKDGSAQNGGNLGWFTVFMMVYPFESAAYDTEIGQVSNVVRSQFGYHIIFVQDKIEAAGKVRTSHIFFSTRMHNDQEARLLAQKTYDSLQNGAKWGDMAKKYSEDAQTKLKGGALPLAGLRQLPDEYLEVAFKLSVGEISTPAKTPFGWHVIRLDAVQPVPELPIILRNIQEQIKRSGRNELTDKALIDKLKKDYNYQSESQVKELIIQANSIEELNKLKVETLFALEGRQFAVGEFLKDRNLKVEILPAEISKFESERIISYADSIAPIQYPAYRFLMQEYEEGLLLFEIMESEVWNKAIIDTVGQLDYFRKNRTNYPAPERYSVFELDYTESLLDSLIKADKTTLINSLEGLFEGENNELKIVKKRVEVSEITSFEAFKDEAPSTFRVDDKIFVVIEKIEPGFYEYDEIRGLVIADYQNYLDDNFIALLRSKHKIRTNKKVLRQTINENN